MPRIQNKRKAKYQIAVVGEGITEWHYVNDLKQTRRYPYKISPELPKNSDYKYVFKKANQLVSEGYDLVLCILDVDSLRHNKSREEDYLNEKSKLIKNSKIKVFETMPCIEYWFLIHFKEYSTKIYANFDSLKKEIERVLPNYQKSNKYFSFLFLIFCANRSKFQVVVGRLRVVRPLSWYWLRQVRKVRIFKTLIEQGDLQKAIDTSVKLRGEKEINGNDLFPYSEIDLFLNEL